MSTTDEEIEALLRTVRRVEGPAEADRAAVRTALGAALAGSAAAPSIASASKLGALLVKKFALVNVALPLVAGALLGAGVSATAQVVSGRAENPGEAGISAGTSLARAGETAPSSGASSEVRSLPEPASDTHLGERAANRTRETPRPATGAESSFGSRSSSDSVALDPLELESRGIAEVQRALRDGRPARALALLEAEERAHPSGALAEERAAARVFTLCSLGKVEEATGAAAKFALRYPRSLLTERVRSSCAEPRPVPNGGARR